MREIIFRGKRVDNGELVYGDLRRHNNELFIYWETTNWKACSPLKPIVQNKAKIDASTLGQYTGLKDKNGKEIYEGDIVKQTISKEQIEPKQYFIYEIVFDNGMFTIKDRLTGYQDCTGLKHKIKTIEVIGNIYEHPHLLGYQP